MGGIVQNASKTNPNPPSTSRQCSITLQDFQVLKRGQGGHMMIRCQEQGEGLFVSKRIPEAVYCAQKQRINHWVSRVSKNSCNVLKYMLQDQSFFCSAHLNFKAVLEYSECSLATILQNYQNDDELGDQQFSKRQAAWGSPFNILTLIKFLIQSTEEHQKNIGSWPIFHTTNVLYFRQQKQLKYLFIPHFQQSQEHQIFFDPDTHSQPNKQSEQTTVFSIGMIIISFLTREDCSDCYDYRHFSFCHSAFEQKLQKLQSLSSKNLVLSQLSYSHCGSTLEDQLIDFALTLTSPQAKRPNFSDLKRKYFKMLRQISVGCESASCISTKRREGMGSVLLQNKRNRLEVNAFQAKQSFLQKRESSETDDTFQLLDQFGNKARKIKATCKRKREIQQRIYDENKENMGKLQYR